MVFSKSIVKVGKAEILNGFVDRNNNLTLFFSKQDNKVYKKIINLTKMNVNSSSNFIESSEILPLDKKIFLTRTSNKIGVIYE